MPNLISASILSANFARLQEEINACAAAGVDWIHVDVMDGHFVPNLTMGPFIVETCHKITSLPLDCHLMIEKPENLIDAFAKAGASVITIHPEGNPQAGDTLQKIKALGCKAGMALNPETPASTLVPFLPMVDLVLVMTVHPGYSGQKYMPEMISKVTEVSQMLQKMDRPPFLEVDGGVSAANIRSLSESGANTFVSASAIFFHPKGIAAGVQDLRVALG